MSEAKATKTTTKQKTQFSSVLGFCFSSFSHSQHHQNGPCFPGCPQPTPSSHGSRSSLYHIFSFLFHLSLTPFSFLFVSFLVFFFFLNCFFLIVLLEEEPLQRTFQVTILAYTPSHQILTFQKFSDFFFLLLGVCLLILISLLCLTRVNCMSCFNGFCILLAFEP